ncbi:hypothetical protein [Flagellimonas sp. GZD32]|uniref:hypothetical protein n=1 Tax=Flagellimonas cixiensis TaxID=3228750 RepID=UPI0035C93AD3
MKKILVAMAIITGTFQMVQAQEEGKFRAGLDFGYTMPDGGGGISTAFEAKYNVADNMNVGIRFESAAMAKNVKATNDVSEIEANLAASSSYLGTFDYYFHNGSSSFAPFAGAGIGYSMLANLDFDSQVTDEEFDVDGKFGGLIRAGFEWGKFRTAINYNLIGKSEIGEGIEAIEVKNSYLGISLGFYVGGGKWKK